MTGFWWSGCGPPGAGARSRRRRSKAPRVAQTTTVYAPDSAAWGDRTAESERLVARVGDHDHQAAGRVPLPTGRQIEDTAGSLSGPRPRSRAPSARDRQRPSAGPAGPSTSSGASATKLAACAVSIAPPISARVII